MTDPSQISGVIPVLVTPFDNREAIVHDDIARQIEAAVAFGVGAVCLPAYASEFYKLSESERIDVVRTAVDASKGRVPIIGQANHPSAGQAADLARRHADSGADAISFALPRQFETSEADLLAYCRTVCRAVERPILVQDFNPGGPTVGPDFCRRLLDASANFRYIKLEEPLLGPRLRAIREATEDRVSVFEGWGGMYLPELFGSGISGVMPGLGHADAMNRLWELGRAGDMEGALDLFDGLLVQIAFSLQNMEFYLAVEKQLLARRGIIRHTGVRALTLTPDEESVAHMERLNERVLRLVERLGLNRRPLD